jgi:agmatine deiminase
MPKTKNATPASLGFCMPAEWEPHEATWIAWPHNPEDWPQRFEPIPWVYAEIVRHLATGEIVNIFVNNRSERAKAATVLKRAHVPMQNVRFHTQPTDRIWTRDSGAIFVTKRGKLAATTWKFNAWAKYDDWKKDIKIAPRMANICGCEAFEPEIEVGGRRTRVVLEGGSIDVNGRGTLLTTEECLLSKVQQRNPGVSRKQMEQIFAEYLGIKKVIWLGKGVAGDDTHGHVDDITRFVAPRKVVTVVEPNKNDPNHKPLQENLKRLKAATDQDGKKLEVIELPLPTPVWFEGQRLPASYANFYIANAVVLVPTFNDPNDRVAMNILATLFPTRKIVGIHSVDFIWGLGAMHCMTQQQPRV